MREIPAVLLREVEYARPASVDDAVRLLAANEGARALAGGQTLLNVMKARAASPDVLVDLNRLDELIVFRRLVRDEMVRIVDIQLGYFQKRLARRGLDLRVSPQAKSFLMEEGWDPQYGARPLKRAIQRHIEDELAKKILGGELREGDTVSIDLAGDKLKFERQRS